jgi:uncharacterized membrane protein YpjA
VSISWYWSKAFLTNRGFLWLLLVVNGLGTIYGYIWYGDQMVLTAAEHPLWQLVFVPDSPTASLFFTLGVLYLLFQPVSPTKLFTAVRAMIEALAVLTCVKYGVWAVVINFAQAAQGSSLDWQNWMLIVSHGSMAVEALLYVRFFAFGRITALLALGWLLLNDTIDYTYGVYPWLSRVFDDVIPEVRAFTFGLSIVSFLAASLALALREHHKAARERNNGGLV